MRASSAEGTFTGSLKKVYCIGLVLFVGFFF